MTQTERELLEALKAALEGLNNFNIKARAAIASAESAVSEPVKRVTDKWDSARVADYNRGWNDAIELHGIERTPPAAVPLTDEQIDKAWRSVDYTQPYEDFRVAVARAIEAAHGITGEKQ